MGYEEIKYLFHDYRNTLVSKCGVWLVGLYVVPNRVLAGKVNFDLRFSGL